MGKIKPGSPPTGGKIPSAKTPPNDDKLAFNFKHLDLSHYKFSLSECESIYLYKFLERLKSLNTLTITEIKANRTPVLRAHPIDWQDTTEPNGFPLNEQLKAIAAWQFQISVNAHGRVHGFFIDRTFFVVWLDPKHKLYA
jgi:hypothetical protein